ncbi:LppU family putative lipoprotein [Rhodococcoides kroppenstedtii]|uniref:LppU family putative lipoprotein n=1 Tax=Rhodococcoides kroppenstedtii TaxID=293050 RepID=UPI003FA757AD
MGCSGGITGRSTSAILARDSDVPRAYSDRHASSPDESNYVVVASSPTSSGCPSDVDQTYYETLDGVEQGALCLDIDFVVGGCMDLGGEDPVRADCSEPMIDGVRVAEIVQDSVDEFDCDTDRAYVYDERELVVCFDSP